MASKRMFGSMRNDYLHCRTVGHQWDRMSLPWHRKVTYIHGKSIEFRCSCCTTERREVWSTTTGEMVYRSYSYPKGYSITRSMVPHDMTMRQVARKEYLARMKAHQRSKKAS